MMDENQMAAALVLVIWDAQNLPQHVELNP